MLGIYCAAVPGTTWYPVKGTRGAIFAMIEGAIFVPSDKRAELNKIYREWRPTRGSEGDIPANRFGPTLRRQIKKHDRWLRRESVDEGGLSHPFDNAGIITDIHFYRDLNLAGWLGLFPNEAVIINPDCVRAVRFVGRLEALGLRHYGIDMGRERLCFVGTDRRDEERLNQVRDYFRRNGVPLSGE
jgi:hypothetical protein